MDAACQFVDKDIFFADREVDNIISRHPRLVLYQLSPIPLAITHSGEVVYFISGFFQ
jgi:hypothetical protein